MLKANGFLTNLMSVGRYSFSTNDLQEALGTAQAATWLTLSRLARQGRIASPARGYYVIVPPEYRNLGCLPAEQFIPDLMDRLKLPYYVGLLSAAQYYGAAHHRPQQFQVMLERSRRPIRCGQVEVTFVARKRLADVPVVTSFSTARGPVRVSSPEATAIDLIGYPEHAGGLDNVATVLDELSEQIQPQALVAAAQTAPLPWAQRLGYILEFVASAGQITGPLKAYVQEKARQYTPLQPAAEVEDTVRSLDWKIIANVEVESEA
ncbi:MAG: type IV toxin-antitoxin system AbiEi family antitoxin [Gammaproteobacteria bacterium]